MSLLLHSLVIFSSQDAFEYEMDAAVVRTLLVAKVGSVAESLPWITYDLNQVLLWPWPEFAEPPVTSKVDGALQRVTKKAPLEHHFFFLHEMGCCCCCCFLQLSGDSCFVSNVGWGRHWSWSAAKPWGAVKRWNKIHSKQVKQMDIAISLFLAMVNQNLVTSCGESLCVKSSPI